jgi:hypothetical protein
MSDQSSFELDDDVELINTATMAEMPATGSPLAVRRIKPQRPPVAAPIMARGKDWFARAGVSPMQLLVMRLRRDYNPGATMDWSPLEHIEVYVGDTKAYITIVKDDAALVLEDDANLFPSDTLLAQLKTIMGT